MVLGLLSGLYGVRLQKCHFLDFRHFGRPSVCFYSSVRISIYPWDMPAMFFYVLIYVAYVRKSVTPLLFILWIGSGFKETVALGSLVFSVSVGHLNSGKAGLLSCSGHGLRIREGGH